ncbi:MAG TPA: response regulator [Polyangiaceae bacterium]|nr:response regulator [Polyangiaceae bacterium]
MTRSGAGALGPSGISRMRSFSPWRGTRAVRQPSKALVLVVDGDGVSRRFVELALTSNDPALPISVESVPDGARALEVMNGVPVDVIVSETDLADMSGLRLCQLVRQRSRSSSTPIVFLSADSRVKTKVVALRGGVDDYLVKPCDPLELRARIVGLIERQRRVRAAYSAREYTLGGDFGTLSFPDLVSILELSRRTGVLSITTPRAVAELCFGAGRLLHASFGNLTGPPAFYEIMAETSGRFEFTLNGRGAAAGPAIEESVPELLMEAARLLDERRQQPASAGAADEFFPRDSLAASPDASLEDEPPASASVGAQFELALSDEFAIGELALWSRAELGRWTDAELGRDRLHLHLVTDMSQGISSLLGLSGPPTERWVSSALGSGEKALGLTFFLRQERLLDLVLLDVQSPRLFLDCLKRRPAATIIAPAGGDALSIGPKSMVELESLLAHLPPAVALWVAQSPLAPNLKAALRGSRPLEMRGTLGDAGVDLRWIILSVVRACSGRQFTPGPSAPPTGAGRR